MKRQNHTEKVERVEFVGCLEEEKAYWQLRIKQQADEAIDRILCETDRKVRNYSRKQEEQEGRVWLVGKLLEQGELEMAYEYLEKLD